MRLGAGKGRPTSSSLFFLSEIFHPLTFIQKLRLTLHQACLWNIVMPFQAHILLPRRTRVQRQTKCLLHARRSPAPTIQERATRSNLRIKRLTKIAFYFHTTVSRSASSPASAQDGWWASFCASTQDRPHCGFKVQGLTSKQIRLGAPQWLVSWAQTLLQTIINAVLHPDHFQR